MHGAQSAAAEGPAWHARLVLHWKHANSICGPVQGIYHWLAGHNRADSLNLHSAAHGSVCTSV